MIRLAAVLVAVKAARIGARIIRARAYEAATDAAHGNYARGFADGIAAVIERESNVQ